MLSITRFVFSFALELSIIAGVVLTAKKRYLSNLLPFFLLKV